MLHLSSPHTLSCLISDVHTVLSLAEKEFEKVEFIPYFSRTSKIDVRSFLFRLSCRRHYYKSVYPSSICVFETLTMLHNLPFNGFTFTRFTVDSGKIDGEFSYVLTLWY